jgi:hypothetical protein
MIRLFISRPVPVAIVYLALGILGFAVRRADR